MELLIGKTAGFCFGVERAVEGARAELKKKKEIFCLGEIVHNNEVIKELEKQGLKFIDNINDGKNKVIIRAHGIEKNIYKKAKEKGIELIDLTCPKVLKIHKIVQEYAEKGFYIFLIGKKEHPETVGTVSYCGENVYIIENSETVDNAIENFKSKKTDKVLVICQTTFSLAEYQKIIRNIISKTDDSIEIEIKNTICSATKLRQEETIELASKVDAMIIIGGKNSSNTNKLYEISKKITETFIVENKDEISFEQMKKYKKVGIMAGASTPKKSVQEVVEILQTI
ncbi:MAG: 4-hydroxy-3-methylbut-2-enyl diphosphate reductase [Clostridiales bacterium]|nr:4-hydroxy-3-methylbut-2-enyl diphosphate reductase [Clostridiales bacterium]